MISSILDVVLLGSLAGTSSAVLLMYRRLKHFDALQSPAAAAFKDAAAALDRAREAMAALQENGGEMAVILAARLNEARLVMNDIDDRTIKPVIIEYVPAVKTASDAMVVDIEADPVPSAPAPLDAAGQCATDLVVSPVGTSRHDEAPSGLVAFEVAAAADVAPALSTGPEMPMAGAHQPAGRALVPSQALTASFLGRPTTPQSVGAAIRAAAAKAQRNEAKPVAAMRTPLATSAMPQPAPSPMPPRAIGPDPRRSPRPPRVEEPKPTLHHVSAEGERLRAGAPPSAAAAEMVGEATFGSRSISWTHLARAARLADFTGGDLAHAG